MCTTGHPGPPGWPPVRDTNVTGRRSPRIERWGRRLLPSDETSFHSRGDSMSVRPGAAAPPLRRRTASVAGLLALGLIGTGCSADTQAAPAGADKVPADSSSSAPSAPAVSQVAVSTNLDSPAGRPGGQDPPAVGAAGDADLRVGPGSEVGAGGQALRGRHRVDRQGPAGAWHPLHRANGGGRRRRTEGHQEHQLHHRTPPARPADLPELRAASRAPRSVSACR